MENKLEKISWKNQKWINEKGKEVKPEPIGIPRTVRIMDRPIFDYAEFTLNNLIAENKEYQKVNAFIPGFLYIEEKQVLIYKSLQFCKI